MGLTGCDGLSVTRIGFNGTGLSLDIFGGGFSLDIFGAGFSLDIFGGGFSLYIFGASFSLVIFGATLPAGGGWPVGIGGSLVRAGLPDGGLKTHKDWLRAVSSFNFFKKIGNY